jgi:activating signal cointegrator complex subunit 1
MLIIRTRRAALTPINSHQTILTTIATRNSRLLHNYLNSLRDFNKGLLTPQLQNSTHSSEARFYTTCSTMGKKKANGEYNDFLDGEKLRDNNGVRTSLQGASASAISPPLIGQDRRGSKRYGKGKDGPKKPQLTHFLCLPLVTDTSKPQLQTGLEKLKDDLEQDALVPTKAVRPLGTLHLTLGVMSLDDTQLEEAKRYLQELSLHRLLRDLTQRKLAEKAAEDGAISENLNAAAMPDTDSLTIDLEALTPMQSPRNTSILYASPKDSTQRLVQFATLLREEFTEKGFMIEDTRPLKLHATIINTIYAKQGGRRGRKSHVRETLKHIEHKVSPHHHEAKDNHDGFAAGSGEDDNTPSRSEGHGPDAKSWMRFDASTLIDRYKDFTWAEDVRIDRVQICRMGAKKIWSGGSEGEGEVVDEKYEVVFEKEIFE